jgi:OOP family OmpA-OmpF porin
MVNQFKKVTATIILPTLLLTMSSCVVMGAKTGTGNGIDNEGDSRRVGKVAWNNQADADINDILRQTVAADKTRLVFVRKQDNDPKQTSANLAVNDRFQVSLHPGNFTVVESCVGTNRLSAQATGFKSNDLLANATSYELAGGNTYFIYVDVDEQGNSTLKQVTQNSAAQLLKNRRYQAHQVTRVTPNCPAPVVAPPPLPVVTKPVVVVPVLAEKETIYLEVLFETDKSIVRLEYYLEIAKVAEFMKKYANTNAVIEGHTDSRASDSYNKALSQRRVEAVRLVLIEQFGLAPDRLSAIGYGESRPRATNDTAEGRQLNRRVAAVIEESPKGRK